MTRRQKDPLRPLTAAEHAALDRLSRSHSEPASHVARAKALLAVAAGETYTAAAHAAGRRSGDAVAQLVTRFNQQGLAAIVPGHAGGPPPTYSVAERNRILAEARRTPDRDTDGTATWSLMTLRRARGLRQDAVARGHAGGGGWTSATPRHGGRGAVVMEAGDELGHGIAGPTAGGVGRGGVGLPTSNRE